MSLSSNFTDFIQLSDAKYNSQAIMLEVVFAMPAFLLYIVVTVVVLKYFNSWKNPFFDILLSLSVADVWFLSLILFYCIPCIILQTHIYGEAVDQAIAFMDTLIWFSQISHLLYVAINRLVFAGSVEMHRLDRWFSHKRVSICLAVIWLFSLLISIIMIIGSCSKHFTYEGYYFGFECSDPVKGEIVNLINVIISNAFPILSFFVYVAVWKLIRDRRSKVAGMIQAKAVQRRAKEEFWMCIQFTIICATNICTGIAFWVVPRFITSKSGSILLGIFAIWNAGVNPYLYLAMNSSIKEKFKLMLFEERLINTAATTGTKPQFFSTTAARNSQV